MATSAVCPAAFLLFAAFVVCRPLRPPIVVAAVHIAHFSVAFLRLGTKYAREIIQYILNQTLAQCCENTSKYPPPIENKLVHWEKYIAAQYIFP